MNAKQIFALGLSVDMKTRLKYLVIIFFVLGSKLQLFSQGYIVPNGVTYGGTFEGPGYSINVVYDPNNGNATGFSLEPDGKTQPTVYTNTYEFDPVADVGVRVFLVSSNNPINFSSISTDAYSELLFPNAYVFTNGIPFYVGLYTGNMTYSPPNGVYTDPLYGWAELENVQGVIELLNSALEYQGGGIYAGTDTIIPTPEPNILTLTALSALLLASYRWRNSKPSF